MTVSNHRHFTVRIGLAFPAFHFTTVQEFIDYDRAHRGTLSYGHAGVGSLNHLTGELFKSGALPVLRKGGRLPEGFPH